MSKTESAAHKAAGLPSALCWVALALFGGSLALPALHLQGRGEWIAGDPGFHCAFMSLAFFPCWVPHVLVIAAPFLAMRAGKPVQKVFGMVLGITTLVALQMSIPGVALTNFRQGLLPGFWLWSAALITATAGLLLGGFSPVHSSQPGPSSAEVSPRSRARPRHAPLLCWLAFAIFVVTNLVRLGIFPLGSFPGGLSRGLSFFVLDLVVIPALLAMAPLACLYAGARTQRFMALALGSLGLLPFLSIDRPAEQPFEALAPLLVAYLMVAIAAAGLLISAGLMNRSRNRRKGFAESAGVELPDRQIDTPEASGAVARGNRRMGAALCWLALAHSFGLGSLVFHYEWIWNYLWPSSLILMVPHHRTLTCSLLAMAPWVCTFSSRRTRRVLGAFLALDALMMLRGRGTWWFGLSGLPVVLALLSSAAGLLLADVAVRPRAK